MKIRGGEWVCLFEGEEGGDIVEDGGDEDVNMKDVGKEMKKGVLGSEDKRF